MHGLDVAGEGSSKIVRVDVQLEDRKHLVEQLLLMEVVDLQGGVHPVDYGMLVHKSGESSHDCSNEGSGIGEVIHNVRAWHQVVVSAHAVMKSGDTINVMNGVSVDSLDLLNGLLMLDVDSIILVLLLSLDSLKIGRAHV